MELVLRHRRVDLSTHPPLVMGILNVTPDSFSDAGDHFAPADATARAREMISEGADIIDVGPESTRPGAEAVPSAEQIRRAVPVIEAIRSEFDAIPISIDTRSSRVAEAALVAGADIINDVSALRDDNAMGALAADTGVPVVLMHRKGTSATMQQGGGPHYDDVIGEICTFLNARVEHAVNCGIASGRIILDPGIGFGKRTEHNLLILRHLDRFVELGHPVLVGASRKSFIGAVMRDDHHTGHADAEPTVAVDRGSYARDIPISVHGGCTGGEHHTGGDPRHREAGSLACVAIAVMAGASILRVHDVASTLAAVRVCAAVRACARPTERHHLPAPPIR
ncbi:MAG: dihydropteroate synthase [Phycisphaerae bacterium]